MGVEPTLREIKIRRLAARLPAQVTRIHRSGEPHLLGFVPAQFGVAHLVATLFSVRKALRGAVEPEVAFDDAFWLHRSIAGLAQAVMHPLLHMFRPPRLPGRVVHGCTTPEPVPNLGEVATFCNVRVPPKSEKPVDNPGLTL